MDNYPAYYNNEGILGLWYFFFILVGLWFLARQYALYELGKRRDLKGDDKTYWIIMLNNKPVLGTIYYYTQARNGVIK